MRSLAVITALEAALPLVPCLPSEALLSISEFDPRTPKQQAASEECGVFWYDEGSLKPFLINGHVEDCWSLCDRLRELCYALESLDFVRCSDCWDPPA